MNPIFYMRTSTKDQNPELQRQAGIEFCLKLGLGSPEIYSEQGSAYKLEKVRPVWESVVELAKKEKRDILVWKYDRCFRNRKLFFEFMKVMFEVYGIKVYSVTEPSILSFWNILGKEYTENPVINELMRSIFRALWDFMIQQAGEEAEEESRKKSERVKLAVREEEGKTISYKGNKWGRKELSQNVINKVIELNNQGLSIRNIAKQVKYYDKNNNEKNISIASVHKIIHQKSEENQIVKEGLEI